MPDRPFRLVRMDATFAMTTNTSGLVQLEVYGPQVITVTGINAVNTSGPQVVPHGVLKRVSVTNPSSIYYPAGQDRGTPIGALEAISQSAGDNFEIRWTLKFTFSLRREEFLLVKPMRFATPPDPPAPPGGSAAGLSLVPCHP